MPYLNVYSASGYANISALKINRDWMDDTFDKHAYHCFPVGLANMLGWTISFPEDIEFSWDGISDSQGNHVTIHQGEKYVFTGRANATISFNTGLTIKTKENVSFLMMPVPNQFMEGVQSFTTIVSTSVLQSEIPCAWKITTANKKILIPAGTPISAFIPISIKDIESYEINLYDNYKLGQVHFDFLQQYGDASLEKSSQGNWTNFYRNAVDQLGNDLGAHESKNIKLKLNDYRENRENN